MIKRLQMLEGGIINQGHHYSDARRYIAVGVEGVWRRPRKVVTTTNPDIMQQHLIQAVHSRLLRDKGWRIISTQRLATSNRLVKLSARNRWHPQQFNYFRVEYWELDTKAEARRKAKREEYRLIRLERDAKAAKAPKLEPRAWMTQATEPTA